MAPEAIYWIADRLAPKLRKQFLAAVAGLKTDLKISILTEATSRQGIPRRGVVAFNKFQQRLIDTQGATLHTIWERTAAQTEKQLAARLGITARFDMVNPAAVEAARTRIGNQIVEIANDTRIAIRQVVARGISEGIPPRVAAKEIRDLVGLTSRDAATVQNYRRELRANGATAKQARDASIKLAQRKLDHRALTIARTENIRASVMGQLDAWNGARQSGLIDETARKTWITAADERRCPTCGGLEANEATLNGLFSGGYDGPPAHPRCRCTLGLTFKESRRRR